MSLRTRPTSEIAEYCRRSSVIGAYFRSSSTVLPIRMRVPGVSVVGWVIRVLPTYVPLVEPRSSTNHWSSAAAIRACRVEA